MADPSPTTPTAPTTPAELRTRRATALAEMSTRDRILYVATDLFVDQGYEATSLREIAETLGVTKAALYYHFKSKEEILRALLEPAIDIQRELIDRIAAARTMEGWFDMLSWVAEQMFVHRSVFELTNRNRAVVESLAESSEFFEDHERLHAQVEESLARTDLPLPQRIRIVCAFGCVVTFDDFGGKLLDEPEDVLRAELLEVVRGVLGLPADTAATVG